jgi:hypothetical protein
MKAIYKFYWDCGRMGGLTGVFVSTPSAIEGLVGKEIYFGEVLGKHSEIFGEFKAEHVEMVSDDPVFVALFESHDLSTGYNPFDYFEESEDESGEEE